MLQPKLPAAEDPTHSRSFYKGSSPESGRTHAAASFFSLFALGFSVVCKMIRHAPTKLSRLSLGRRALSSIYQSKHNSEQNPEEVRELLERIGVEMKETRDHFVIKDCSAMPEGFCGKPLGTNEVTSLRVAANEPHLQHPSAGFTFLSRLQDSNQWKVYVKSGGGGGGGGTWFCHRCGSKGSWYDLKRLSSGGGLSRGLAASASPSAARGDTRRVELRLPNQALVRRYPSTLQINSAKYEEVDRIREYLTGSGEGQRGLSDAVLIKYGVGVASYQFPEGTGYVKATCITFPWVLKTEELQAQVIQWVVYPGPFLSSIRVSGHWRSHPDSVKTSTALL